MVAISLSAPGGMVFVDFQAEKNVNLLREFLRELQPPKKIN